MWPKVLHIEIWPYPRELRLAKCGDVRPIWSANPGISWRNPSRRKALHFHLRPSERGKRFYINNFSLNKSSSIHLGLDNCIKNFFAEIMFNSPWPWWPRSRGPLRQWRKWRRRGRESPSPGCWTACRRGRWTCRRSRLGTSINRFTFLHWLQNQKQSLTSYYGPLTAFYILHTNYRMSSKSWS